MNFPVYFFSLLFVFLVHVPGAADEMTARNLLISQGCKACHKFEGAGGIEGPSLDRIGQRLDSVAIERKLLRPQATNRDSVMPNYRHLTDDQIEALVNFLEAQK